jgi:hypothetical protein
MTQTQPITMRAVVALVVLSVAGLSACTSADASTAPSVIVAPPPSATASAGPSATETPSAAAFEPVDASAGPSAVATSIDPCQLVSPSEVATVTGFEWGPPSPVTMDNNGRDCEYGQEGYGFDVIVVQAPDAATAKAQEPAFKAQLEQAAKVGGIADMKLTELPDFVPGVDAAILHGSSTVDGTTVDGVAFYALKGPVLLAMTELASFGGTVASDAAMEAEAKTALGRIP